MRRIRRVHVLAAAMTAALCVPASGVSSAADDSPITKVGKGEGSLNLIAWEGYTQPQWVKPFTKATGCKVKPKYGGTSDEMVTVRSCCVTLSSRAPRMGLIQCAVPPIRAMARAETE